MVHQHNTTLYNDNFGVSRFIDRSYYGGHYGSDNNHNYALFSASGIDFIVINLGFGTSTPPTMMLFIGQTTYCKPIVIAGQSSQVIIFYLELAGVDLVNIFTMH